MSVVFTKESVQDDCSRKNLIITQESRGIIAVKDYCRLHFLQKYIHHDPSFSFICFYLRKSVSWFFFQCDCIVYSLTVADFKLLSKAGHINLVYWNRRSLLCWVITAVGDNNEKAEEAQVCSLLSLIAYGYDYVKLERDSHL